MQADRLPAVTAVTALEDLAGADLIIEAAAEDLEIKKELFRRLDEICPEAILATNTSSLSVTGIAHSVRTAHRVVGLHFFNPPVAMKLVELVQTPQTSPEVFAAVWDFALTGLRKTPVDVKYKPGFIVNRVIRPYYVESQLQASAGIASLDGAARAIGGVPMGRSWISSALTSISRSPVDLTSLRPAVSLTAGAAAQTRGAGARPKTGKVLPVGALSPGVPRRLAVSADAAHAGALSAVIARPACHQGRGRKMDIDWPLGLR